MCLTNLSQAEMYSLKRRDISMGPGSAPGKTVEENPAQSPTPTPAPTHTPRWVGPVFLA